MANVICVQVQLHRGARNLPVELPGFACHLGMEGSHQTYIMDPIFGSEEQKREGPEGWYPSLGVERVGYPDREGPCALTQP